MADISLAEVPQYLKNKLETIVTYGTEAMRDEAPSKTGALRRSIKASKEGEWSYFIGTDIEHAKYVEYGRGEVRPVRKKALHWVDGGDVFAMRSKAVAPNDFVGRAKARIEAAIGSII